MPTDVNHLATLSPAQQRIRDKCYHPTGTFIPFPKETIEQSIPERFEEMVRLYPDRLAVKNKHGALTYAALNQQVNRLAHAILDRRGEGEEPVTLLLEHGIQAVVAILGVLKAGKIYVSLEPSYPRSRLAFMLQDTRAQLMVTNTTNLDLARELAQGECPLLNIDDLVSSHSVGNPALSIAPDTLACLIYTSGSTGQPKGVLHPHRNLLRDTSIYSNLLHLCPEDRISLLDSCSFAGALRSIYSALLNGARLCAFDLKNEGVTRLAPWLLQEQITFCRMVSSGFRHFAGTLREAAGFPALRALRLGGEPVYERDVASYKKHFSPDCVLITSLGPTESLTFAWYFMDHASQIADVTVPVGYVLDGADVMICDDTGVEVGFEQVGEIVVKSCYLSPGYWRRPDLTSARFAPVPGEQETHIYYTGDRGLRHADGCLVHMGRQDLQVKIRGYRVELAEVESALLQIATIKEAVVMPHEDQPGAYRLVAYVMPAVHPVPTVTALRQALTQTLPDYMMPSTFVYLDALLLLPNGKIDRRNLPVPGHARPTLDTPFVVPRTPIEVELARIWTDVLNLDRVGVHDTFLELGGHSLLATQILSRIVETFQVDLPLQTLFEAASVSAMAVVIAQYQAAQAAPHLIVRLLAEVEALGEQIP